VAAAQAPQVAVHIVLQADPVVVEVVGMLISQLPHVLLLGQH
jgi:hypothetical protein